MSQVTSYGGELRFTVTQRPQPGSSPLHGQPLVVLQGNGIVLEHHTSQDPSPGQPSTFTVPFREVSRTAWSLAWGGADPCLSCSGASVAREVRAWQHTCPLLGSKHGNGLMGSRPHGSTC